jgi:hypothetical protein
MGNPRLAGVEALQNSYLQGNAFADLRQIASLKLSALAKLASAGAGGIDNGDDHPHQGGEGLSCLIGE